MMQQTVNLEGENGPDIGYSDYKIRRSQYRLDVKFMKYSELHPIATGHEEDRNEEEGGLYLKANYKNTGWKKQKEKSFFFSVKNKCHYYIITTLGNGGTRRRVSK